MNLRSYSKRRTAGLTLVEMMIATAIGSLVLALALTGSIMVQRSFLASDFHATAQNDQLRLSDYLSRDLRPATSIVISRGGQQIDLRVPAQDAPILGIHIDVPVLGTLISTNTATDRIIRYTLSGTDFYREENGARLRLARNVTSFTSIRAGAMVTFATSFAPQYSRASARASQEVTTLRQSVLVRYALN